MSRSGISSPDELLVVLLMVQSLEQELLTVLIINIIISFDNTWLVNQPTVVSGLLHIWVSPDFHDHHRRIVSCIQSCLLPCAPAQRRSRVLFWSAFVHESVCVSVCLLSNWNTTDQKSTSPGRTMGDFTFWISLSLRPKFGPSES